MPRLLPLVLFVCVLCRSTLHGISLDTNFTETTYASTSGLLTGLGWPPDGSDRLFVSRMGGQLEIIKHGTNLPTPFATISPVYTNGECGLIGFCFHPNFVTNGYVYTFVSVSMTQQQIIRYTAVGDVGTQKTVIVSGLPTLGGNHDGGAVGVGRDGKLYWGIGDNAAGVGVDGDLLSLASKIGRANLDGTVPLDNPFRDGPGGANDYIWARGFRNPFTLAFEPTTGALWVNSAGELYEQIFLVQAGDHAGWNDYENTQPTGYLPPKIKYRTHGTDTRNITTAVRNGNVATFTTSAVHGFRQGEKITIAGVADTSFNGTNYITSTPSPTTFTFAQAGANAASSGGTATTHNLGGAVTGGCFYDSTGAPAGYRGNLIFADVISGRLMRSILGTASDVRSVDYFVSGITFPIDVAVGPDGAMYYGGLHGQLFRLAYNFTQQQLVVTPINPWMFEDGATALTVRLALAPATNVNVTVARTAGDTDIAVAAGAALTFTPANWSVPQIVRIEAVADLDFVDDLATVSVSAAGLSSESVQVRALDPPPQFAVGPISKPPAGPVQVSLNGDVGRTYVMEANSNLLAVSNWVALSTNQLLTNTATILDTSATNLPSRFYRARLLP